MNENTSIQMRSAMVDSFLMLLVSCSPRFPWPALGVSTIWAKFWNHHLLLLAGLASYFWNLLMLVFFIPSFLLVFSQRFRFLAPSNVLFCFHILVSKTTWHMFEAAFETVLVINGAGGRRGWRRRKSRRGGILPTDQPQCAWVIPKNP